MGIPCDCFVSSYPEWDQYRQIKQTDGYERGEEGRGGERREGERKGPEQGILYSYIIFKPIRSWLFNDGDIELCSCICVLMDVPVCGQP